MAKLAVVQGAILKCDKGATPSPLSVTTPSTTQIEYAPVATIMDYLPGANIKPFGACAITGVACVPVTPIPWFPGEESIPLVPSIFPILSDVSILPCAVGGMIEVMVAGQSTVIIDSLRDSSIDAQIIIDLKNAHSGEKNKNFSLSDILLLIRDGISGGFDAYLGLREDKLLKRAKELKTKSDRVKVKKKSKAKTKRQKATRLRKIYEKNKYSNKSRRILRDAKKLKLLKRGIGVAGHAPAGIEVFKHGKQGNYSDAVAIAGGETIGEVAAAGCFIFFTGSTVGLGAIPAGIGCSVGGGIVGDKATPIVKKVVDAGAKEGKHFIKKLRFWGNRH